MARRPQFPGTYPARWPQYLPYPTAIRQGWRPVPNGNSVDWPQAQFAPPYLPPGSPSYQPYLYPDGPRQVVLWPQPTQIGGYMPQYSPKSLSIAPEGYGAFEPSGSSSSSWKTYGAYALAGAAAWAIIRKLQGKPVW